MSMPIQAVVLGATGYVGGELLRLLATHPDIELAAAVSGSRAGEALDVCFPHLSNAYSDERFVAPDDWPDLLAAGASLALFSALPHGASAPVVKAALSAAARRNLHVHVVDSSADFRYASAAAFESVYGIEHGAPELLADFSCAVPEHADKVQSPHVGHPGCFATAVLLASVPMLSAGIAPAELFVSGITGSTGAGKCPQAGTHHPHRHSNLYAYKALAHRHTPEIAALAAAASGVAATINFVPHSGPFARGIYVTVQAKTTQTISEQHLRRIYRDAYQHSDFVSVVGDMPKLKDVVASNFCHLGVAANSDTIVVTAAIDNLVKGAAGGALQWMNRLWGLPESAGLLAPAPAWT